LTHPVPVPIVKLLTCKLDVVIVDAKIELVKKAVVEVLAGMVERYPIEPRPLVVESRLREEIKSEVAICL
jgi:hypothetical protein